MLDLKPPLNYYSAFYVIKKYMPKKCIYVGEGASKYNLF